MTVETDTARRTTLKALIIGPGLITPGRVSKSTHNALADLSSRGYESMVPPRQTGDDTTHTHKAAAKATLTADCVILLPGWEDLSEAVVLSQLAISLGTPVLAYADSETEPSALKRDEVIAPIMPGFGVLAPDANEDELPHEEAARMVLGPRGAYYGTPLKNLGATGLIWTGLLASKLRDGQEITAEDVALCMVGLKLSREANRHKRDNITDSHGYLMTIEMIREERDANEQDPKKK
jgi:hypothetical protein